MPYNNPLTKQELLDLSRYNPLHPRDGSPVEPYMPEGYLLIAPHDQNGPIRYRLLDAGHIKVGIMDPDRLGTGADGNGNKYLADDGTWKTVTGSGGTPTTTSNVLIDGGYFTAPNNALIDAGTFI